MLKKFKDLTEREILAIAIANDSVRSNTDVDVMVIPRQSNRRRTIPSRDGQTTAAGAERPKRL